MDVLPLKLAGRSVDGWSAKAEARELRYLWWGSPILLSSAHATKEEAAAAAQLWLFRRRGWSVYVCPLSSDQTDESLFHSK